MQQALLISMSRKYYGLHNVSAEINKIIRERVLPPFRKQARKGNQIEFTGAIELNKEHLDLSNIEVLPVEINLANAR